MPKTSRTLRQLTLSVCNVYVLSEERAMNGVLGLIIVFIVIGTVNFVVDAWLRKVLIKQLGIEESGNEETRDGEAKSDDY